MANWSVTQGQLTTNNISGFAFGEDVINMTISSVVDGVDSYYNVEAANFIIGGDALETSTDSLTEYVFNQGNVDKGISKVVFTNNGIIGQPDNTVNVAVHLSTDITTIIGWPTNLSLYVDIDERSDKPPVQQTDRLFCIRAYWGFSDDQTVTVTDLNSSNTQHVITEVLTTGDASTQPNSVHQGNIPNNLTTEVARLKFVAAGTHYYAHVPTLSFNNVDNYGDFYSSAYTPTFDEATGRITEFTMQVYYTPPVVSGLYPDPYLKPDRMCQLAHQVHIAADLVRIEVPLEDHISSVAFENSVSDIGGSKPITVEGTAETKYFLNVKKTESLTSSTAASSNAYWDFTDNKWVDSVIPKVFEIPRGGTVNVSYVNYETNSGENDIRYDITLSLVTHGSTAAEGVPNGANPGIVIQDGYHVATVNPYSADHTVFAAFPTIPILRRKRGDNTTSRPILAIGGNGGSSSTKVVLQTPVPQDIAPGQIVTVRNTANASIIAHNTTVVSLRGTVLTLSAAAAIPNGTEIRFDNNDSSLEAFDMTITADTGRDVAPIADKDVRTIVSGISSRVSKVGGGSSGTTVGFTSGVGPTATADGIAVGAKMTGAEVVGDIDSSGTVFTIVTAVNTLANTITVAHSQVSALTGVDLTFSNSDTFTANDGVELIDAQVHAVDVNNVKLQGYFKIKRLDATGTIALNIDKIITNTAE